MGGSAETAFPSLQPGLDYRASWVFKSLFSSSLKAWIAASVRALITPARRPPDCPQMTEASPVTSRVHLLGCEGGTACLGLTYVSRVRLQPRLLGGLSSTALLPPAPVSAARSAAPPRSAEVLALNLLTCASLGSCASPQRSTVAGESRMSGLSSASAGDLHPEFTR